jgi:hypothetical protein
MKGKAVASRNGHILHLQHEAAKQEGNRYRNIQQKNLMALATMFPSNHMYIIKCQTIRQGTQLHNQIKEK